MQANHPTMLEGGCLGSGCHACCAANGCSTCFPSSCIYSAVHRSSKFNVKKQSDSGHANATKAFQLTPIQHDWARTPVFSKPKPPAQASTMTIQICNVMHLGDAPTQKSLEENRKQQHVIQGTSTLRAAWSSTWLCSSEPLAFGSVLGLGFKAAVQRPVGI